MPIDRSIPQNGDDGDADVIRAQFNAAADVEDDLYAHTAHTANPHATTAAQVGADPSGTASAAISAHTAAADPHPQYALESSLSAVATSGAYADLTGKPTLGTVAPLDVSTDGTLASNSDTLIPSQKAVKTYADQIVASADALVFKAVIDCSVNPNYPAADRGWTYRVSVAGKIGGASGVNVEAGDLLLCLTDGTASGNQATVGAQWSVAQTNVDGAVIGPASATDSRVAMFDGASGKLIKDSGLTLSGSNTGDETGARIATLLHAASNKTSLVDADEVNGTDSAASFGLIRTTWTNVKAFLKTYFDGLYAPKGTATASGLTMTTARLLGRNTMGTGAIEEITLGTNLSMTGATLNASGGGGSSNTRWIGAGELIPRATNGAGIDGEELATNKQNLDYLAFDAGTQEFAQASFDWPSGYTTFTAAFYWTAASGSTDVVWRAAARCYADTDSLDQAFGTAQSVTDTLSSANTARISSATSSVTPGGTVAAGNLCIVQIDRDATNGSDTLAVDARLIGVRLVFS